MPCARPFPNFPCARAVAQELNDALYALAAIEARFLEDARIEWGNTLTNDLFLLDKFDAIVANPPYGVDWKDFKKHLEMDASGRFDPKRMPPTSDGELLFLQHAAFHLSGDRSPPSSIPARRCFPAKPAAANRKPGAG